MLDHWPGPRGLSTIILIHKGSSDYLEICIRLLSRVHQYRVVLIGDATNRDMALHWGADHVMMDQYRDPDWEEKELGFVHNSYLPLHFEKFCFIRFNILLGYATDVALNRFIYLDSDIMILNRSILENFDTILPYMNIVSLSDKSTFFSGWTLETLREFVGSLSSYFQGDPCGDRHCDMFAFKRFVSECSPETVRTALIENTPIYDQVIYGNDPNFSFAPLVMRWANIWGYDKLQNITPNIDGFITVASGRCYVEFPESTLKHRLDFVHLNGFMKSYLSTVSRIAFEVEDGKDSMVAKATPTPVPLVRSSTYEPLLWEIVAEMYRGVLRREGEPHWHKIHVDNLKKEGLRGGLSMIAQNFIKTEEFRKRNRLSNIDQSSK